MGNDYENFKMCFYAQLNSTPLHVWSLCNLITLALESVQSESKQKILPDMRNANCKDSSNSESDSSSPEETLLLQDQGLISENEGRYSSFGNIYTTLESTLPWPIDSAVESDFPPPSP